MQPSSTYSRLLLPVIASAGVVGLSIGLIIPLTSIVLEQRGIPIIAIGLNATVFWSCRQSPRLFSFCWSSDGKVLRHPAKTEYNLFDGKNQNPYLSKKWHALFYGFRGHRIEGVCSHRGPAANAPNFSQNDESIQRVIRSE